MKKFLAVLLAVAMVISLVPMVAFADAPAGDVKITIVTPKDGGGDRFQFSTNIAVEAGDEVKIVLNASGLSDGALSSDTQYIRGVSGLSKQGATVVDLGDGWVELSITAASATSQLAFTLYGGSYGADEYILVKNISVDDEVYSFTSQDDVDAVGFTEYSQPEELSFAFVAPAADDTDPSYLQIKALEDFPSRPEHQLKIAAPIAAGESVTFDFRPVMADGVGNDDGIFDVRSFSGTKLFYAKPEIEGDTITEWDAHEQEGESKNNGTVDMTSVSFEALEDGWFRATFKFTKEQTDGFYVALGYYTVEVDNLTVGTKTCSFDEANVVEFAEKNGASLKFDDGTEFSIARATNGFDWVASLAPVAEDDANTVPAYVGELNSSDVRSGIELTESLATGDVLSFFVKVVPGAEQDLNAIMAGLKLYVRGTIDSDNKAYYIVGGDVTDKQAYGSRLKECAVDCGDGWYYVEVSIPAEDVYFLNLNAEDVSGAKLGEGCMYADICVNGTPITSDIKGYSSKEVLTATQIEVIAIPEPVVMVTPEVTVENATVVIKDAEGNAVEADVEAGTVVTVEVTPAEGYEVVSVTVNGEAYEAGTEITVEDTLEIAVVTAEIELDETEDDETEDVEPTGAISAVVVAIAAVIGGAVVLKKREF